MRVTISSSQAENIDEKYKKSAIQLTTYLAKNGCDLNWGSGERSIMGICYEVFSNNNRKIYGYTSPKYVDELPSLSKASHNIYDDTFDLKKHIFYDADLIICLPGGTGTISEFFAYLEEIRSNDVNKNLVIYNDNHHFDSMLALIEDLVKRNFNNKSIKDYYTVINNFEEFKDYFTKLNK